MNNIAYINEDLKGRMLRHVAALWGVKNTDALDPLVKLLVEALAGELQKTHQEIHTFEKRILEKTALLMTPGILSAPYAAHAVAQAQPVEAEDILSPFTHFFHTKKKAGEKDAQMNLAFTPVGNVKIFDAQVMYLSAGSKVYTTDPAGHKVMFLNGQYNPETSRNIWVGIQVHPDVKDLDQLCFFFDFKNTDNKKQLFRIFHSCEWYFRGKKIKTHNGLCYQDGEKLKDIFSDYDPMLLIEREVRHLYDEHFVTLTDDDLAIEDNSNFQLYPDEFASVFMRSDLAKFKDNLLWIKIVTPTQIEERVLIDLYLTINAFPVINRKLRDFIYRFKGVSNIIPVETDEYEYFLSVQSLRDGFNKEYKQIPYSEAEQERTGTYSVRKSGTERIDSRSAREFLMYLVELMRDESAAFSSYGQDAVNNMLKELDRILAMLEQRIKKNNPHADTGHYVSVDYENRDDAFFLNYWVTNSIYGNGIHAGTKLAIYQGSQVKNGTIQFLTNTLGGKMALEPARHIDAYKYAMLSHNKIVTVEDIKAFCFYELGDRIADVAIRKGLVIGENPKQGLVRCVDVILKKKKRLTGEPDETEWGIILNSLKSKMELRSSLNLNIRFLLDE